MLLCVHLSGARPGANDDQSHLPPGLPSSGLFPSAFDDQELHDWKEDTRDLSCDKHMADQSSNLLENETPAPRSQYQLDINLLRKSINVQSCIQERFITFVPCLGRSIPTFKCRATSHTDCTNEINTCGIKSCTPKITGFPGCNDVFVTGCQCGC